jgi:hypothetical protein
MSAEGLHRGVIARPIKFLLASCVGLLLLFESNETLLCEDNPTRKDQSLPPGVIARLGSSDKALQAAQTAHAKQSQFGAGLIKGLKRFIAGDLSFNDLLHQTFASPWDRAALPARALALFDTTSRRHLRLPVPHCFPAQQEEPLATTPEAPEQ